MPFPGSQQRSMVSFSYFMHHQIWWMRLLLYIIVSWQVLRLAVRRFKWRMVFVGLVLVLYGVVAYFLTTRLDPQRMFQMPEDPTYAAGSANKVSPGKLVIGVVMDGEAKAYPIEIIAYHHQIRDRVGRTDILVTYCSLCRSARVYDPRVQGQKTHFRLVGIDMYNAMMEDDVTGSWWQQASGVAVAGKAKGEKLTEIPAQQMTLDAWSKLYPNTLVLQADEKFLKQYGQLAGYDEGTSGNSLESRDMVTGAARSWVAVASVRGVKRSYDWTTLEQQHILQDTLNGKAIAITLAVDGKSFFGISRQLGDQVLDLTYAKPDMLRDTKTSSTWSITGKCISGCDSTVQLESISVTQEYFHSFQHFGR